VPLQAEIYERLAAAELDPELSWSEKDLPERQRTKHVHRLHPYLGKYVPQLVEVFLRRHFRPGDTVLDPFAGSGTTLVEASTYGCNSVGIDISAFNALLCRVKTATYNPFVVERDLRRALDDLTALRSEEHPGAAVSEWLAAWFAPQALADLLAYRSLLDAYPASADLMTVLLSRTARSARLVTHFDLDFPKTPQTEPYYCRKHARTCRPTQDAFKFLRRYTLDTIKRVKEYERLRTGADVTVIHGDARSVEIPRTSDGLITSPPYPGRIDYHEQHRYAFELLGLADARVDEIGAGEKGTAKAAVEAYVEGMVAAFEHARRHLARDALAIIVIDDQRGLYDGILAEAGFAVTDRRKRHVNRRTGRRQGEFFEEIIFARARR
jgi:DNA modification methylase